MRPIILIGWTFARSQWMVLAIMVLYVIGMAIVFGMHEQRSEALFFVGLHAGYAVALGALLAAPAIHNERRSRRILMVLSKGVHRWQYLAGILCGCAIIEGILCINLSAASFLLVRQAELSAAGLGGFMVVLFLGSLTTASMALFFSSFLHPVFSLGAVSGLLLDRKSVV